MAERVYTFDAAGVHVLHHSFRKCLHGLQLVGSGLVTPDARLGARRSLDHRRNLGFEGGFRCREQGAAPAPERKQKSGCFVCGAEDHRSFERLKVPSRWARRSPGSVHPGYTRWGTSRSSVRRRGRAAAVAKRALPKGVGIILPTTVCFACGEITGHN